MIKTTCRVCERKNIIQVLDLGKTPLANSYQKRAELKPETYPLQLWWCTDCYHVQLRDVIDPTVLFTDYLYVSSTSSVFVEHFEKFAKQTEASFVVDIGSNDGILLRPFQKKGVKVVGVEPSANIAKIANDSGIETMCSFFSQDVAKQIVEKHGQADLVTATNVFAHIDDLDEVIRGVKILLTDNGTFVIEAPYILDMFDQGSFDLIYHEHLSYWSVKALQSLFSRFSMVVTRVDHTPVHGGSIRVYVKRRGIPVDIDEQPVKELSSFQKLDERIHDQKIILNRMLKALKHQGKTIIGYGAPAKATTLLSALGVPEYLDWVIDDSPMKQGLYLPGTNLKIETSSSLERNPDYILLLAWNFADAIMKTYPGRKWILPFPTPKMI